MQLKLKPKFLIITFILIFFSISAFAESIIYTYDDLNRLTMMNNSNGTVIEYIYDEVGNRTQKIVYKPPVADFTVSPESGVVPLIVNFTDTSYGNITSWHWDFGDGTTSILQNPDHIYNLGGTYTVTLTTSNLSGIDTMTKAGFIIATPPSRLMAQRHIMILPISNGQI